MQDRVAGPIYIPDKRTTNIQTLIVLDYQAKAAHMYAVSDVLQKMIQTFM
jgi:hypothetical protein